MEENQTAPVEYNGNQIKDRTEGFAAPSPVSREKPQRDWGNLGINESWQQLREERIQNAINEAPTVLGGVRSMVAAEQRNREQHRAAQQARVGLAQESLELRRQELADRIRHNAIMRGELNPDSEAMIRDIAAELGVSEEAVRTDPEFYKNKLSAEQLAKITAQNPSTASFYSNPDNVAVAHDDSSALTAFENAFKAIGDTNVAEAEAWGSDEYGKFGTSFAAGAIRDFGGAVLEGASAIIEQSGNLQNFDPNEDGYVSTRIEDKDARDALYAPSNAINDWVNGWDVPKDEQTFLTQVGAAMGQFAGQTVAAVATGGASAVASPLTLILQGAGSMHKQLLEDREKLAKEGKPIPTEMEEAIALYAGTAITALTEKFGLEAVYGKYTPKLIALAEKYGLNKIVKMYESQAGRMALNRLVGGIGEGFQENTENILQTALRKGLIDKDIKMPTGAELFDEFAVSFVSSLAFGAVADMRSTVNSIHENQALTAAADAAQESKLRGRQTQLFQSFVEGTTPEGRKTIYIEKDAWDKHHEGLGLDPAKAAERYGIENYGESPHYLEMPTSRWASDFASTEAFNALKPHIKINADPSYLTPSETSTKIKMQKAVDKQLSAYAAGLESEGNLMPKTTEAGTKIIDYIANQLGARWQDGTARTNATLFASAFVNMQIRDAQSKNPNATDEEIANNITTDLFERYALKVNALAHINNAMQRVDVKMDPLIEQLRSRAKGTNARLNEAEEQELKDLRGIKSKDLTPEQRARRDELVARKNGILRTSKHKIFVPEGVEGRPDSGEINVVISHNADGSVTVNDDDFFGVTTINSDHAKNLGSDEAILKDRYPAVYGSHETISDISYQASPEMSDELKALDEDIKAAGIDLTQTTDNNQVRELLNTHLNDVTEKNQSDEISLYQDNLGRTYDEILSDYAEESGKEKELAELLDTVSLKFQRKFVVQNQDRGYFKYQDALNNLVRAKAKAAGINLEDRSNPVTQAFLIKAVINDISIAFDANPSALGWYDEKVRKCLGYAGTIFPELNREVEEFDINKEFAFIYALAVTSNGLKVDRNLPIAVEAYRQYRDTGKFKLTGEGEAARAINNSLEDFNRQLDEFASIDEMRKFFMSQWTVRQMGLMGENISGEGQSEEVRGAAVLGPKIGNGFFSNMNGEFSALTMDRWFMRTFGRMSGSLIKENPELLKKNIDKLKEVMRNNQSDMQAAAKLLGVSITQKMSIKNLIAASEKMSAKFGLRENREELARLIGQKNADTVRKAINNVAKNVPGEKVAPAGAGERTFIRKIFNTAIGQLQQNPAYSTLNMADAQAVLWYAEKLVYEATKPGSKFREEYNTEEAPDYANVMRAVAIENGVSEEDLNAVNNRVDEEIENEQRTVAENLKRYEILSDGERLDIFPRRALGSLRRSRQADSAKQGEQGTGVYQRENGKARQSSARNDGAVSEYDGSRTARVLGRDLLIEATWKPGNTLKNILKESNQLKSGKELTDEQLTFHELRHGDRASSELFKEAIDAAKKTLKFGAAVESKSLDELDGCRLFISADGKSGFALKSGDDIVSVFSTKGQGNGDALIELAIAAGGRRLDCFNTILPAFYAKHGFRPVARVAFNKEYAPEDWDYDLFKGHHPEGCPDIVFMVYDDSRYDAFTKDETSSVPYVDDYGEQAMIDGVKKYEKINRKLSDIVEDANSSNELKESKKSAEKIRKKNLDSDEPTVFNQSGDNRRGSIVKNNGKFTINLFKKADFSTFAHETGHFMLFMLEEMATRDGASDWAKSEWEHVKNYLGLKDGVPITTKQHEKFARSFEAYLREGKAPSVELQDVFSRFKAWLLDIYKTVAKLKAPINNEIRGVFDRLLASDQQIELAKQANGFIQNLFSSAKDMGVSQEEFDAYQKLGERAINDAKDKMLERLMQDNRREKTKEWQEEQKKVEQKLRQDYKELPDVINLQTLTDPTGFIKISTDELKSRYGKEWMSKLPKIGKNKIHADNGMAIDEAAKLLGYETGDDMMDALSNLPSEDEFVKQNAEAEMRRRHGDLLTSEAIADAATEALMNDKREDLLLKELSILDRMKRMVDAVNKAKAKADAKEAKEETRRQNQFIRISKAIYREGAKAIIWGKKIRDIKPGVYLSAIRKAREDAIKAMAAKDYNAAFDAKQQELLSTLLYREARDMIKNVEANKRKFARINKGNEKKLAKTREMSFIYRARYLLARHGLGRNADQWMEKLRVENKNGNDIDMTEEPPVEYWLMSAEEFSSFADLVNGLWYQSRAFKTAEIDGKKVEIQQIGEEIAAVMEAQGIADVSEPDNRNKLVTAVDAYATSMKRVEQQFTMMGGEAGPLMKYIFQPMKDACVNARLKYSEVVEKLNNIVTKLTFHPGEIVAKELIDRDTGKAHVFGRGKVSGGAEVWGALLHSGNPSNLRKLLLGYGWCKENPDGTIDTRNWDLFMIRMQKEGILTKDHMEAAQAIWDVYEELKPLSQKANKYIYGYHFKEVDAPGITNVFGSYRGGYVPARCDTRLVKDAEVRKIQEEHNKSAHNLLGMTQPGFTQSRVENYADKLDLNPQTIMSGTADIVNFAYIAPVYKDVARILRSNLVSSAFHRYEPGYMTTVIHPWMNRAMMQTATTDLSSEGARTIADLRSKAGALLMFFNIKNTVQQMADLVVSASQVKRPGNFMSALMNSGKKGREFAMEKSIFMRDRMGESQHQMMDRINEILVDASRLDKYNRWFMNHAYFTQQLADDWASTVTWIACYNDALQDGADDLDAVRHADAAVRRVLMSQNPEDVSNIESGTAFYRAFTQFSGFFVTRSNVVFSELGAIAREAGARAEDSNATKAMKILANRKMKAGMVIFTKVALPAVLDTALALAVKGILPDDDEWQADIFEGAAEYVIGLGGPLLNLGKNVVSIGKEMITGEKKYGNNPRMASAPFVSIIEDIMSQARKIYTKKNGINPEAILKLATDATMFTAHVPMQLSRDIGYLMKVQQGKVKPTGPIDFVRGAITGVASPASK